MKTTIQKPELQPFQVSGSEIKKNEEAVVAIKSIAPLGNDFVIRDEPLPEMLQLTSEFSAEKLPGVLLKGVHYYDLQSIGYINNTGMAKLIGLLRSLLQKGVGVRFVNVSDQIRSKIKKMGLDHILPCS